MHTQWKFISIWASDETGSGGEDDGIRWSWRSTVGVNRAFRPRRCLFHRSNSRASIVSLIDYHEYAIAMAFKFEIELFRDVLEYYLFCLRTWYYGRRCLEDAYKNVVL